MTCRAKCGEFDGPKVYARTKRAEVVLTELWAEQLAGTGVVVHAMHPGWADTPGVRTSLPRFYKVTNRPLLRTPARRAPTRSSGSVPPRNRARSSGRFWHDRRPRSTHRLRWTRETREERERLLAECARLSGWHDTFLRTDRHDFHSPRRILMAHSPAASIDIQQPREEVFAYLSDFSTTRERDPGRGRGGASERSSGGRAREPEFRLVAEFLGRKNELTYRIVEHDPPHAVTLLGENATVISRDRITFDSTARGHTRHLRRRPRAERAAQDRRTPAPDARV